MFNDKINSYLKAYEDPHKESCGSVLRDWTSFKERQKALKEEYSVYVCVPLNKDDNTLALSIFDIKQKIKELVDVDIAESWIIKTFHTALVSFTLSYKPISLKDYILSASRVPLESFSYVDINESIEAVSYSDVKFDLMKTMAIMKDVLALRLLWKEFKGC